MGSRPAGGPDPVQPRHGGAGRSSARPAARRRAHAHPPAKEAHAQAESEALVSQRAYNLVSHEFQRQNRRLQEQEDSLRVQKELFETALNNMSQGLCMFDAAGALVVCNERYQRMYRLPAE